MTEEQIGYIGTEYLERCSLLEFPIQLILASPVFLGLLGDILIWIPPPYLGKEQVFSHDPAYLLMVHHYPLIIEQFHLDTAPA